MEQLVRERVKLWGIALVIGLLIALLGKACYHEPQEVVLETITVNAPQAMHKAFEETLNDLKLNKKYQLKFIDSKDANFTVTNRKSDSNNLIAYSPVIAVFNDDEELYENYIQNGVFVPSETEPEEYDFDFQKIMLDIIENPKSMYKVYYPDETLCNWSVFYAFLLYTANDGCYPSEGTNMQETREVVDAFLKSKNTEPIKTINKIGGFAKNSIYLIPLADLGYIYENKKLDCRVMYPKTVVYSNYYASYDEVGKILYDGLEDTGKRLGERYENVGYRNLLDYGNYFVKPYGNNVSISYYDGNARERIYLDLRKTFNAVDAPETTYTSK